MARGVNRQRVIGFVISCLAGGISFSGYAQPVPLKAIFTGPITLDSITHYMNIHTDIRLTFNSGKIKGGRAVVFPGRRYDVNGLLEHIQRKTGLSYSFYGKHVIFRDHPQKAAMAVVRKKRAYRGNKELQQPKMVPRASVGSHIGLARTDTITRHAVRIDTGIRKRSSIAIKRSVLRGIQPPGTSAVQSSSANETPPPQDSKWILRTGVFANEVFYVNGGIEAGIRPVSLLFSVGSNFHVNSWHIGLSSAAFKYRGVRIHVTAGYSPLKTTFGIDSGLQTINVTAKGQWYDLGLAAYIQQGKHWLIKAGVSCNLLRTSYYKDGALTTAGRYFMQHQNPDKLLYLLRPPLKFVNTYDRNSSSNIKLWPGLSLGLYYSFF